MVAEIFERRAVLRHRGRAQQRCPPVDFLHREVGRRLADRLSEIVRRFPLALDLSVPCGLLAELSRDARSDSHWLCLSEIAGPASLCRCDFEALPVAEQSVDLVTSAMALHQLNDLPGCLAQIRRALKPDGAFLASFIGGESLGELRQAFLQAESRLEAGAHPHIAPFVDIRSAGALLQRAGFTLPVIDIDTITVTYDNAFKLMQDLRHMGEGNALSGRHRRFARKATFMEMAALYQQQFGDTNGRIPATFQIINLTAWAPHRTQPQPLMPASAKTSLADLLAKQRPRS